VKVVALLRKQTLVRANFLMVLLDLNVPMMSGWEVMKALQPVES
jgi:CheY-like chemotaxis protein